METRVRVAALIVVEERVLLVAASSKPEYLVPPGGGWEPGESLAEAVVRETAEEAGLTVAAGPLAAYREVQRATRCELELYFHARPLQNPTFTESVSAENRRVVWVPVAALPQVAHFPGELAQLCALAREPGTGAMPLPGVEL